MAMLNNGVLQYSVVDPEPVGSGSGIICSGFVNNERVDKVKCYF